MIDIADTALTFCRDVLGWADASLNGTQIQTDHPKMFSFAYSALGDVMGAVRTWLKQNSLRMAVQISTGAVAVEVWQDTGSVTRMLGEARHEDLGAAVMAACVNASHELKGAA